MVNDAKLHSDERAFTRTDVLVAVGAVAVILFLAFSFVVVYRGVRAQAQGRKCLNNLKAMSLGFRVFANDNETREHGEGVYPPGISLEKLAATQGTNASLLVTYYRALSNELGASVVLVCPADSERVRTTNWNTLAPSNLSYFLSLDARPETPEVILMGDRNLESRTPRVGSRLELTASTPVSWGRSLHEGRGQFSLAEGSVHQAYGTNMPPEFLRSLTKVGTNRLEFP